MSNRNLSLSADNWKKLDKLMKKTNKSTRQAAVAEVLDKAGKCDYWEIDYNALLEKFSESSSKGIANYAKLQDTIKLYRITFVVLTVVAIAGWVL